MSRSDLLYVISYDIGDDRRRRRVARLLEDIGTRVQFSVFEARISASKLDRTISLINDILDEGDNLRSYCVGKAQEKRCAIRGSGLPIDSKQGFWLF